MGRFLIFIGILLIFSLAGMAVWLLWNKLYIYIKRKSDLYEIEEEAHKRIKRDIREGENK